MMISMNADRDLLVALSAQLNAYLAPPLPEPAVVSPTGRQPRLLWTPRLQTGFNRMQAEGADPLNKTVPAQWGRLLKSNALGKRYGDTGLWATLMFQATGDVTYAAKAMSVIQANIFWTGTAVSNHLREYGGEYVIMLDWLWPALTDEQRAGYFAALDRALLHPTALGLLPASTTLRLGDSDQTTGVYLMTAMYGTAFGDVHPLAAELLARPIVGGLDSTGSNALTLRNAVRGFVERAAVRDWTPTPTTREWVESGEYNIGTVQLLLIGTTAVRTATGVDHFPEVTAWATLEAPRNRHFSSPDLTSIMHWGDDQGQHGYEAGNLVSTSMLFDDPHARQFVTDVVAQYGAVGYAAAEPHAKSFLLFDPYGPVTPKDTLPLTFDCSEGQGIVIARSSWRQDASQFFVHFPPTHPLGAVDHGVGYFGDLQLYRRGGWALTHPITYGGPGLTGEGINSMLHCGFGAPIEYRGHPTVKPGDWLVYTGTAGGAVNAQKYYAPPATFWHEHSRRIEFIPGEVDTLIVFDRTHVDDPQLLPGFLFYSPAMQAKIKANPLRQWRWHCPVQPTLSGNTAEWPIASGVARVTWLRDDLQAVAVNQQEAWATYAMAAAEKKWHVALTPTANAPGFQTLVTILQFGDPAKFGSVTPPTFNLTPGPKLPSPTRNLYDPRVPALLGALP